MDFESSAIDQVISAIEDYSGYTTEWDKTIFEVQDFDSDIPSGIINNGRCPFVAIRGGLSDDYTQVSGDLYEGTTELEIYIAISAPLIFSRESWAPIHTFTGEIERAIATLDGDGFRMSPHTSKDNPVSLNQMVNRVLTISIDGSECRETPVAPEFQTSPVISGTPEPGETLTAVHGTATGSPTPVITGEWYLEGVATGDTDLTYIVPNNVGDNVTFLDTATNDMGVDTALSNQLEIVSAGIEDFPIAQNANNFIWCRDAVYNSTIGGDILDQRRTSDNDQQIITAVAPDGFFDTATWSTHTSAGADPAFASTVYDQSGSNNAIQTSGVDQPGVDSVGDLQYTSVSKKLGTSTTVIPDGDNFTIVSIIKQNETTVSTKISLCNYTSGNKNWYFGSNSGKVVIGTYSGAAVTESDINEDLFDGSVHCEIVTYDSAVGLKYYLDGVEKVVNSNITGTINATNAKLFLGFETTVSLLHDKKFAGWFPGATIDQAKVTEICQWATDRGLLV